MLLRPAGRELVSKRRDYYATGSGVASQKSSRTRINCPEELEDQAALAYCLSVWARRDIISSHVAISNRSIELLCSSLSLTERLGL